MLEKPADPLPDKPGCYIFRNARGRPLYVGKAKSLKKRVAQYFQRRIPDKIVRLRSEAASVETIVTGNEWEAFLLESNLIKQFKPRFNTLLKDDKSYPFVVLTMKDTYPKARVTRRVRRDGSLYFGPFVPGWQAKKTVKILQEHFRIATCKDPLDGSRPRPCLYYEMGQCYAPCMKGRVNVSFYRSVIEEGRLFLEGKTSQLRAELSRRMQRAAEGLEYEIAAHYRDLLQATASLGERQRVTRPGKGHWDFFALVGTRDTYVLHGFVVVDGKVVDRRRARFHDAGWGGADLLSSALKRLYADTRAFPDGVAVSLAMPDRDFLSRYLSERKGRKVPVVVPRRGEKAHLIRMLEDNARIEFEEAADPEVLLAPLVETLGLPGPPRRIECFDISHSGGEETVASCVVWEDGAMRPSQYRSFRIRTVQGIDDFASLGEATGRRYLRLRQEGAGLPDLLLLDGGAGQVSAVRKRLEGILGQVPPLAGLAKRLEELHLPGDRGPVRLPRGAPALHLLQEIRDEAHRFAVTRHRKRRSRARLTSPLLRIPGVGPATARKLLKAFLTTDDVLAASQDRLAGVVGPAAARRIRAWIESPDAAGAP